MDHASRAREHYKDGYRTDCSGYVSMAWNLSSSRTTWTLIDVCGHNPIGKDDLQPGDVLIKNDPNNPMLGSHVVIFAGWVDANHTSYLGYEQTPPQTRYDDATQPVPYPYFGGGSGYQPYRYDNVIDAVPQAGPILTLALQASSGQYVGTDGGAGAAVNANRDRIGPGEIFDLVPQPSGRVSLRTSDGRYLSTAAGGGSFNARAGAITASEVFAVDAWGAWGLSFRTSDGQHYVVAVSGGGRELRADIRGHPLGLLNPWVVFQPFGGGVALRARKGQYVTAVDGGGAAVRVDGTSPGKFQIMEFLPSGDPHRIVVRTANHRNLFRALGGGGGAVDAGETVKGRLGWETYQLVAQPNGQVALRTVGGYYVTAENGGGAGLLATSNDIGPNELFDLVKVRDPSGPIWAPPMPLTMALRSYGGYVISAAGGQLSASSSVMDDSSIFISVPQASGRIALRTYTGHYVDVAIENGESMLLPTAESVGEWENFNEPPSTIFEVINNGDALQLRSSTNAWFVATGGGAGELRLQHDAPRLTWTLFYPTGPSVAVQPRGPQPLTVIGGEVRVDQADTTRFELIPRGATQVAIRVIGTLNVSDPESVGLLLTTLDGGGGRVTAAPAGRWEWQTFDFVPSESQAHFHLRTQNGRYVTVMREDGVADGNVWATAFEITPRVEGDFGSETFALYPDVEPPSLRHFVKKIFVLMLENRSFDHMLGYSALQGRDALDGAERIADGIDPRYPPTNFDSTTGADAETSVPADYMISDAEADPGHEFHDVLIQLAGPSASYEWGGTYPPINNSGFIENYRSTLSSRLPPSLPRRPANIMNCFRPDQLPVLNQLAKEFAVCDRWFSSMPGPTWPNRFFVHSAYAGDLDDSPEDQTMLSAYLRDGIQFTFRLDSGEVVAAADIFGRLDQEEYGWRVFHGDCFPQVLALWPMKDRKKRDPSRFADYSNFQDAIADPFYDAAYTFIEPSYGNTLPLLHPSQDFRCGTSQHPLDDVTRGEALIKHVYEAIRNSPHWMHSVLIITYDEHGGFFDHVPPPPAVSPGRPARAQFAKHGFTFEQLGVRVPAIVISPFIRRGTIDHTVFDHASVPATLERLFGLSTLTPRDATAADVLHLLSLPTARTDTPECLCRPADSGIGCTNGPPIQGVMSAGTMSNRLIHLRQDQETEVKLPASFWGLLHVAMIHWTSVAEKSEDEQAIIDRYQAIRSNQEALEFMKAARWALGCREPGVPGPAPTT